MSPDEIVLAVIQVAEDGLTAGDLTFTELTGDGLATMNPALVIDLRSVPSPI